MSSFVYTIAISQWQSNGGPKGQLGKLLAVRLHLAAHGVLQAQGLSQP